VNVHGDLGAIDAGTAAMNTVGLKSLTVQSLGFFGLSTGAPDLGSDISGTLGALNVSGDVRQAHVFALGGKMGSVTIGGSLFGGTTTSSGEIFGSAGIGMVKIGQDIQGGSGSDSGIVFTSGSIAGASVGGSLIGGSSNDSGKIISNGKMSVVTIGQDIQGGTGARTGEIATDGDLGVLKIGGDLRGGSISGTTASLDTSGYIEAKHIDSVTVGGSIVAGTNTSTAGTLLTKNASIRALDDIAAIKVLGSLIGNSNANGTSPVIISARRQAAQGATTDVAIHES
jgi:hypothetical protein